MLFFRSFTSGPLNTRGRLIEQDNKACINSDCANDRKQTAVLFKHVTTRASNMRDYRRDYYRTRVCN